MTTFLLTWNPAKWNWKDLSRSAKTTANGRVIEERWSTGNTRHIEPGDRVFLMRQGQEPRGLFGSGTVIKGSFEAPHWDEEKRKRGMVSWNVIVAFDRLVNPEVEGHLPFSRERLRDDPQYSNMTWDVMSSGVRIPDAVARVLEADWKQVYGQTLLSIPEEVSPEEEFFEGGIQWTTVNAYERNARARRKCLEYYGTECTICGLKMARLYGSVATDLIHVHHLVPLAYIGESYKVDPIKDLRPVCPNCHAVIHRRQPPYSIDEVKSFLHTVKR